MQRRAFLIVSLLALCRRSSATNQTGADGLTAEDLDLFLSRLQRAVADDDRAGVAALIFFPLRVNRVNRKAEYIGSADFGKKYSRIFTEKVRGAIMAQRSSELFRNYSGAMIGRGEVWMSGICKESSCASPKIRVMAINVR
jgi:hypothetical protein